MPLTGDSPCNATRPYQRPGAPRPWRTEAVAPMLLRMPTVGV